MASRGVNKVILVGHLGKDPEVRFTPNGVAICNLTLATSESWVDKNTNEKKEQTEWHRVVMYRRLAEIAGEYLRKGSQVYLEGKLQTRKWQDQQGQDRYTTEIVADQMQMLGSAGGQQGGGQGGYQNQGGYQQQAPQQPAQNAQFQPQGGYQQQAAPQQQQGGYNRPAPQQQQQQMPSYDEPPMDFDDDIPF